MKTMLVVGVLLLVLGAISLVFQGIPYKSERETVQLGPIHASSETTKKIPLPPVLGGFALAGGTILVVMGARKARRS